MSQEEKQRTDSAELERVILLKLCEERKLDVSDEAAKSVDRLKDLLGMVVLPAVEKPNELGFEEQILRVFAGSGQITKTVYDSVLQALKNGTQTSLGHALEECGAVTPDLAATLDDGKSLVERKLITIPQFMVALFDHQTANISIKQSLSKRGWLKELI